ncbi:TPA: ribonuclease P protein subunit [Candidatus Micrarchaeota archaeon]|nr:ribonuclease P protein subunit [Candidatus Micrarchaeota archaeon]
MDSKPPALGRKPHLTLADLVFLAGELVGERVKVLHSSGKGFQGIEGKIVDESRNTFVLDTANGRKRLPKSQCVFYFPAAAVTAVGTILVSRPEDRTKKISKAASKKRI